MLRKIKLWFIKPTLEIKIKPEKKEKNPFLNCIRTIKSVYGSKIKLKVQETVLPEKIFLELINGNPVIISFDDERMVIYGLIEEGFLVYSPTSKKIILKDTEFEKIKQVITVEEIK